ncbi:SdpI family protein [Clostridium intestinale]|uniref:SdpI family protein n=1 Tax=Clostridium intestinale TaxID=36845 RepID=UPI0028E60C47|nr:SdpI family protein [Clostridium intestinale]
MWEEIFIFVSNLIIPAIMLFFGMIFKNQGPKKINGIYGYRTSMSMKNKETWDFAHRYCGKLWTKLGLIILFISIIISLIILSFDEKIQGIVVAIVVTAQTILLIVSIFPVEKELKKNFDKDGNRRIK